MTSTNYQPPVAQLLTYGKPKTYDPSQWFNYVEAYGFTEAHIPDLIQMATDADLNLQDEVQGYAPIHACRALGQLQAEAAIQPLLSLLDSDDDWFMEELPEVFGVMGPICIPALTDYLSCEHSCWNHASAAEGLTNIAQFHTDHRQECVQILTEALARYAQQSPELNGSLVAKLLDLNATEAVDVIEKAYKEGPMDEMVCGSWATVQIDLGLATKADFTAEELQPKMSKGMETLQKLAEQFRELIPLDDGPELSDTLKAAAQALKSKPSDTEELAAAKPKSSQPKYGFASLKPKKKKKKKR